MPTEIPIGTWDRMQSWDLVLPPSRPDELELGRIMQATAHKIRDEPVGILGSTPEFRDLLYEAGFTSIYVLERNPTFFEHVTAQRIFRNQENIVIGDWLDVLPSYPRYFSLILSDLTAGNISYTNRTKFYASIAAALAPGGLFIDKVLTNENGQITMPELEVKYSKLPLNLQTANYFSCEAVFCSELQLQSEVMDTTVIYSQLKQRLLGQRL